MLIYYFVIHSTVTKLIFDRLSSINNQQWGFGYALTPIINSSIKIRTVMRTLNSNQLSSTLSHTKSYTWNSKRRYR